MAKGRRIYTINVSYQLSRETNQKEYNFHEKHFLIMVMAIELVNTIAFKQYSKGKPKKAKFFMESV